MTNEFKLVAESIREGFLFKHFGRPAFKIESAIYRITDSELTGYKGGYWDFCVAPNGQGFMVPPASVADKENQVDIGGREYLYNSGKVSRIAAGLALTTLAVNRLWNAYPNLDVLGEAWERLMEAINQHPESSAIRRLLD